MSSTDSSILDEAAGPTVKQSSGPVRFVALRDSVYDETTGRTYQLVKREGDSVPHCVSVSGNHAALLDTLNSARALSHERNGLAEVKTAAADKRRAEIKAALKDLDTVSAERTDRTARMLTVYAGRGIS